MRDTEIGPRLWSEIESGPVVVRRGTKEFVLILAEDDVELHDLEAERFQEVDGQLAFVRRVGQLRARFPHVTSSIDGFVERVSSALERATRE